MAGHRVLLLLLAAAFLAAVASAAEDAKPTILTPVAHTPLPSFEGDTPAADDAMDDDDAAPVGAPTGATMTEPKPPLTTITPGGAGASDATSGASALGVAAARVGAVVAVAAGVFVAYQAGH